MALKLRLKRRSGTYVGRQSWIEDYLGVPWHMTAHLANINGRIECVGFDLRSFEAPPLPRRFTPSGPFVVLDSTAWRKFNLGAATSEAVDALIHSGEYALGARLVTAEEIPSVKAALRTIKSARAPRRQGRTRTWTPEALDPIYFRDAELREVRTPVDEIAEVIASEFGFSSIDYARKMVYKARREAASSPKRKGK